jgi:hypothetical protein
MCRRTATITDFFQRVVGGRAQRIFRWCGSSGRLSKDQADDRDDGGIVLNGAFESEGIVIGAARPSGIFATRFGAPFIDGAAACFWMEKLARHAEKRVLGAFQDARSVSDFRVFSSGFFDGNSKMSSEALDVEIGDFYAFVDGAAESDAFRAIVLKSSFFTSHGFVSESI